MDKYLKAHKKVEARKLIFAIEQTILIKQIEPERATEMFMKKDKLMRSL
jgi:hypothetical protein